MTYLEKLKKIEAWKASGENANRICSQLIYLDSLSDLRGGAYDEMIEAAADLLLEFIENDGAITKAAVLAVEDKLLPLKDAAKSLTEIFVSHAHIDMNWQWGYNETANVTVDTFRTILTLMREYPEYTFAQSQASTYEIIEKYRPDMLDEIRQRIKEGRWEVTAAEWVEPDKNMPSGESLARQLTEARKYLTKLLDIPADKIAIDFVPDTFGHAAAVPEILCDAGIKYMYHCRGLEGPCIYKYRAPSGKEILAYREYRWYNSEVTTESFEPVAKFCKQEGIDTCLCVYGVGDHGGGPSRRDIERIIEYSKWPYTPNIKFGTFREFFEAIERANIDLPVVDKELNFLFSGCYTTQARIKMSNRVSEDRMLEAEALSASASAMAGSPRDQKRFEKPWRNILFNHFHDILPGSGTIETREHAMGKFQDTLAALQTSASASMYAIADKIDTTGIDFDDDLRTTSEGGGVGHIVSEKFGFRMPSAERGRGQTRVIHVFNPTAFDRDEVTEITVWDHNYDPHQTVVTDVDGNELEFSFVKSQKRSNDHGFWGHTYKKIFVKVKVKAFGYTTLIVKQKPWQGHMDPRVITHEHTDHTFINNDPIVLENEKIRAVLDKSSAAIISLTDKITGEVLIDQPSGTFKYIEEDPLYGYIAWRVGPYMKVEDVSKDYAVKFGGIMQGSTFTQVTFDISFKSSSIKLTVTLLKDSQTVDYDVTVDWQERPVVGKMIPQLAFAVPVSYKTNGRSQSLVPFGVAYRDAAEFDIPSHGALGICGQSKHIVAVIAPTKYGFRCVEGMGQLTLLRNSYEPDPYSDQGIHRIRFSVAACAEDDLQALTSQKCHPMPFVSGSYHKGSLPASASLVEISKGVCVSSVKNSEDDKGLIVRMYDTSGKDRRVALKFIKDLGKAYVTDLHENILRELCVDKNEVSVEIPAYSVITLKVEF